MSSEKDNIIKRQLQKKINKLANLEKQQQMSPGDGEENDFKISRTVIACIGGFIIYRTFSKTKFNPFTLQVLPERLEVTLRRGLPIEIEDGRIFNLVELLKGTIGINLNVGTKLDIGSKGGGITIGNEIRTDGFQIMIFNYTDIEEISETLEDINFAIYNNQEIENLKQENEKLKNDIETLSTVGKPMIITEGKTDWRYFLTALRYFHSKKNFLNIKEEWFLKFGSDKDFETSNCGTNFILENSVTKLNAILESFIDTRKIDTKQQKWIRIGIYDSDDKQAKIREDFDSKVFSVSIEPENISTELLFSNDEIKTYASDRRLYLGSEFDSKTGQLIADRKISIGNDNNTRNKAGKNVIIDANVYNSEGKNIALSKEEFSNKVFNNEISISDESWKNFEHIFLKLSKYT